jgi:AraC-like DNA-binding protein
MDPTAARGLENSLVETLVDCLGEAEDRSDKWVQQCHSVVMRRFRRLLEDNPDRALYVPEICAAIAVPDRTLRLCCKEHLGMSPMQYLGLRRMHLAHRALRAAAQHETTVTEVATHFGFWHFGRFAVNYQALFGERPSVTLNTPHDGIGRKGTVTWV